MARGYQQNGYTIGSQNAHGGRGCLRYRSISLTALDIAVVDRDDAVAMYLVYGCVTQSAGFHADAAPILPYRLRGVSHPIRQVEFSERSAACSTAPAEEAVNEVWYSFPFRHPQGRQSIRRSHHSLR